MSQIRSYKMKNSYFLVTNSNKFTWKKKVNTLYLGEWCYNFQQSDLLKQNDLVAKPYGINLEEKNRDHELLIKYKSLLLEKISFLLNNYHNTNFDNHFWKIVLGNWLERFIAVIINRFHTIQCCIESYNVTGSIFFESEDFDFVPKESREIIFESNNDKLNSFIYQKVLEHLEVANFNFELIPFQSNCSDFQSSIPNSKIVLKKKYSLKSLTRVILNKFCEKIINVLSGIKNNNAPFIIRSYLPFLETFKFHLLLGAIPREWHSPKIEIKKNIDYTFRNKLKTELSSSLTDKFEQFIFKFIPELLPMCFVENFKEYSSNEFTKKWPTNPRFIYTSNCFDTDEIFKIWAAQKSSQGIPFYIGQHGNNYGTYRYMSPSNEEEVADKFITWGWGKSNSKYKPAFIFKTVNIPSIYDKKGGLLLIEYPMPTRIHTWDVTFEFKLYWNEQVNLVKKLPIDIKNKLIIRLHQEYSILNWHEVDRWHEIDNKLKIDRGQTPLNHLISNSRLVVHSYDSTGILETLSMNIPTLAFWQGAYNHLNEESIQYYKILKDAGIIHFNYLDISDKIISIWDDIDQWWFSDEIQTARQLFCNQYAKVMDKPLVKLKQILED
jgi:putative transferase (TIGR04331 family)